MQSLEARKADRLRRRKLADRELSPSVKKLGPQDKVDYNDFTVPELRKQAEQRGLEVDGTKKADYIAALEAADQPETAEQKPEGVVIPPVPTGGQPWGNQ